MRDFANPGLFFSKLQVRRATIFQARTVKRLPVQLKDWLQLLMKNR